MKKKSLIAVFTLLVVFTLTACGSESAIQKATKASAEQARSIEQILEESGINYETIKLSDTKNNDINHEYYVVIDHDEKKYDLVLDIVEKKVVSIQDDKGEYRYIDEADGLDLRRDTQLLGNFNGIEMTVSDVVELSKLGDKLKFSDLKAYNNSDVSSNTETVLLVFYVHDGYRLVVGGNVEREPTTLSFEKIESSGEGIDIRFEDVEKFLEESEGDID